MCVGTLGTADHRTGSREGNKMSVATQSKERPILFSGPMVRAIMEGRKTQTRRIVSPQPEVMYEYPSQPELLEFLHPETSGTYSRESFARNCCKFGLVGERLWVRESFCQLRREHYHDGSKPREAFMDVYNRVNGCAYAADTQPGTDGDDIRKEYGYKWTPSIHMPRWASRITLEITDVRVERLNDLSEADAIAEGIEPVRKIWKLYGKRQPGTADATGQPRKSYVSLWEAINGPESWAENPFVWVVQFRRIEQR